MTSPAEDSLCATVTAPSARSRHDDDPAWPTVEDQVDPIAQLFSNMFGCRRTDTSKEIGAGGGNRDPAGPEQFQRQRMIRDADADCVQSGSHQVGNRRGLGQHERQWPGPELVRQCDGRIRKVDHQIGDAVPVGNVNN